MINKVIALAIKFSGLGWVWDKLNGLKTKLGVGITVLSGAALVLSGAANLLTEVQACEAMSCVVGIIRIIGENSDFEVMLDGFKSIGMALAIGGAAHKIMKAEKKNSSS